MKKCRNPQGYFYDTEATPEKQFGGTTEDWETALSCFEYCVTALGDYQCLSCEDYR